MGGRPLSRIVQTAYRRLRPLVGSVAGLLCGLAASALAVSPPGVINDALPRAKSAELPLTLSAVVAAVVLVGIQRFRRRISTDCPSCGSHAGAWVGQVGNYQHAYRCHACGFLWEPHEDAPESPVTTQAPR